MGDWLRYDPALHGHVPAFCELYAPSTIGQGDRPGEYSWLTVQDPNATPPRSNPREEEAELRCQLLVDGYKARGCDRAEAAAVLEQIYAVATAAGCTVGKWLLFPSLPSADRVWHAVCEGTVAGKLGDSAKISPCCGRSSGVICVYVTDFTDKVAVYNVLEGLRAIPGAVPSSGISFKTDIATASGIYPKQTPGLSPALYRSSDFAPRGVPSMQPQRPQGYFPAQFRTPQAVRPARRLPVPPAASNVAKLHTLRT